jgi:hypothetical protein
MSPKTTPSAASARGPSLLRWSACALTQPTV